MSTIDRFSSVRAKIGCRSVDQLPAMVEGVLGGRFYKFTYEVEEVLVRNPVIKDPMEVEAKDAPTKPGQTPKRKRADQEKEEKQAEILGFVQIKNWTAIKLLALQAAQQLKQIKNNNLNSSSNEVEDHSDSLWNTTFVSALAGAVAGNLASDAFSSSFSDDSSYDSDFSSFSSSSSDISGFGGDFGGGGGTANF